MLIINNGVPKSGSTWVNKIVRHMLRPRPPAEAWCNNWANASIDEDRLADYVASDEWRTKRPVLIKMHLDHAPDLGYLQMPGIKMIVSHRNLPDSVLSLYHHQVRLGETPPDSMVPWLEKQGLAFAKRALRYRENWHGVPGVLMCRYEDMVADAPSQIARIAQHLGHKVSPAALAKIATDTQVRLNPGEAPRDGAHTRTGGQSRAALELPPAFLTRLEDMDRQATARLTGAPRPGAGLARPELVLCGVPQGANKELMQALAGQIDSHMLDQVGPWPQICDHGDLPVPPGAVRVHRSDQYARQPQALEWLARDNPDSLFVLVIRDPADALMAWYAMYHKIANGPQKDHLAWTERAFYAQADAESFYQKMAGTRLHHDRLLLDLLDVVPAARLVVVDDAHLRAAPDQVAADLITLAQTPARRADFAPRPLSPAADPAALAILAPETVATLSGIHQRIGEIITTRALTTLA